MASLKFLDSLTLILKDACLKKTSLYYKYLSPRWYRCLNRVNLKILNLFKTKHNLNNPTEEKELKFWLAMDWLFSNNVKLKIIKLISLHQISI